MAVVGEIIRMAIRHSAPGASEMLNVFHHIVDTADVDDDDVLDSLESWATIAWAPNWNELASSTVTMEDASVDVVDVNGLVIRAIGAFVIGVPGIAVTSVSPAAVAGYILLKTVFPKTRGIKYLPGIAEGVIDDGLFNAQGIAALGFLLIEYAQTINTTGPAQLVPGVPSPSNGEFVPFLDTGILETVPAYQRRRKPNVGS